MWKHFREKKMFCILIIVMVTCVDFPLVLYVLVINLMLEILYKIQLSYLFIYLFNQSFENIEFTMCQSCYYGGSNEQGRHSLCPVELSVPWWSSLFPIVLWALKFSHFYLHRISPALCLYIQIIHTFPKVNFKCHSLNESFLCLQ